MSWKQRTCGVGLTREVDFRWLTRSLGFGAMSLASLDVHIPIQRLPARQLGELDPAPGYAPRL